ncbi:hypothetical protein NDU88_005660 [Pleurodeles waltl]|uniref:Uncharacterized protein n=1 Tax=Pleurodeles waltl TaxID=8319 RepID=A0AAV7SMA2_PLEWA|nr:hypothetical protein NDU88_005660 [Pleurodeles waltl]
MTLTSGVHGPQCGRMPGDDTGVDDAANGGPGLWCGTVLRVPYERRPQATVQTEALVSAGVAAAGMPRLWCEQAMPDCGAHRLRCEQRLGEVA